MSEKTNKTNIFQFIKFALFSASAGIIQIGSFTLMNEVLLKTQFMQNLIAENEAFGKIMTNEYGPIYLIALLLSVIWNFTFNRKFTFKSAANVPVAMLKVALFYLVFTPLSTWWTNALSGKINEYIIQIGTMLINLVTEYLYCRFVVYRNSMNTNGKKEESEEKSEE